MSPSPQVGGGLNISLSPVNTTHPEGHDHIVVAGYIDFSHTGDAFALAFSIFAIGMFKTVIARVTIVPNSVMLLIAGVVSGLIISCIYPGEIYLKPGWFFHYLLPVIVFEAGFCMKNKDFFNNLGTILVYAVLGTVFNIAVLSALLYYTSFLFTVELGFSTICLFCVIICAVDPVAVLTVFDDMKVNELLYICVFGESLLNDAVTIVLYQAVNDMISAGGQPGLLETLLLVKTFLIVSFGGIGFGVVFGYVQAGLCRLFAEQQQVQPILLLFVPYMTYLLADSFKVSGLLALIICGMISKNYAQPNISEDLMRFSEVLLKFLCSYSESFIFVFLGISLWSDHEIDFWFMGLTLIGICFARFVGTILLTALSNSFRAKQDHIGFRDQFIMAYGGLRGAVCYGLVMSLDGSIVPHKKMLVTTTIFIVAFTTIVQGGTIRKIVGLLNVRLSKKADPEAAHDPAHKVFALVQKEVQRRVVAFMEDLTHARKQFWIYHKFVEIDERYIKPNLIAGYAGHSYIGDQHKLIEIEEYTEGIRCGSFAGLPHVSSAAKMNHSYSNNDMAINGNGKEPMGLTLKVPDRPIPRNESISGLVQKTFNNVEWDIARLREPRRSIYSRHQLEVPPAPAPFLDVEEPSFDDRNYIFTYPGPKPTDRGKLARDIKAFAARQRQLGKSPSRRRPASISESSNISRNTTPGNSSRSVHVPRFHLSTEDETDTDPMPTARSVRTERKLSSSGGKQFIVGGDEVYELLPIHEEDHETSHDDIPALNISSSSSSKANKRHLSD